jgi:hypothetical protein
MLKATSRKLSNRYLLPEQAGESRRKKQTGAVTWHCPVVQGDKACFLPWRAMCHYLVIGRQVVKL